MPRRLTSYSPIAGVPRHSANRDNPRARQGKRKYATYSKTWRAIRAAHLREHPWCEHCLPRKRFGTHVDHIDNNSENNDPSNLQTLCTSHHSTKTAKYDGGFGNAKRREPST